MSRALARGLAAQFRHILVGNPGLRAAKASGDIIGDRRDFVIGIGATKAGMDMTPRGVRRRVPVITIWATLVAAGSLTALAPAIVA